MSYSYQEELSQEAQGRYATKLQMLALSECPYKVPADTWTDNPKQWPDFAYPDLYHYLINEPRVYSKEAMKNFKSLEAYRFFISGWVQTVWHLKLPTGDFLFKADVRPSYRVNEEPHHPWLAMSRSGTVITAHCDCKAGLGETCSHVAGVLFKIEAAVRLGYSSSACTDEPCKWNSTFCQEVKPTPISDMKFYRDSVKAKRPKRAPSAGPSTASAQDEAEFLGMLSSSGQKVVALSLFADHTDQFIPANPIPPHSVHTMVFPDSLRSLYKPELENFSLDDLKQVSLDHVQISREVIGRVEEATRNQASCTTWHTVREGRVTASVAHDCLHTDQDSPAPSLIKKICFKSLQYFPPSRSHVDKGKTLSARDWGNVHEHDAYTLYEHHMTGKALDPTTTLVPTGKQLGSHQGLHQECVFSKFGFLIDSDSQCFVASPDGVVCCTCCGKGGLEIKCPFSCRDSPLEGKFGDRDFYITSQLELDKRHRYYTQVQFQMFILQVPYVDFVVCTPQDFLITRVIRDQSFIDSMVAKLKVMWENHFLPELLTRNREREITESTQPASKTTTTVGTNDQEYCICKTTTDLENMVGCDACNNWFHLQCLKLKRFPKSKTWYCKDCRKKRTK